MIDPKLFLQIDLSEPIRLSPKVFINREDDNYFAIGLYDTEKARSFLTHFLAVIYSFCDYCAPDSLIGMWPEETFNQMLKVVITLKKDKILLTESEYKKVQEEILVKSSMEEKEFNDDTAWKEPFEKALKTIPEGANIFNLGAKGGANLAIQAAKNGAGKVVSVTNDFKNSLLARRKAMEVNAINFESLAANPTKVSSICYAEKFNVLLTELFCSGIFEEQVLEAVIYVKKNFLASDAMFIPYKMDLKAFAYETNMHRDMVQESKEFEVLYNFDFEPFTKAMSKHIMGIYTRLDKEETKKISEEVVVKSFDFKTLEKATFDDTFEIEITNPGKLCGICTYFELHLTDEIKLTNSPFDPQTKHMQRIFTPADSIYPEVGDKMKFRVYYDGNYRLLMP